MTATFAELGLSAKVLAAIEAAGYPSPTPIQAEAIPIAVTGRDVLGIAQTGTGKTASFVLPMITRLESGRARARMPRSLILAPTRELAAQCAQSFEKYGVNHKLSVALLIGGVSMDDQVQKLDRGADVLIATPGRMLDHFQRGKLMLMGVEILVIDEADRMLDMGFIPDIEKICKLLPPRRQTLFFSATMPPEITRLVAQFLKDPVRIEVAKPATTAATITQRFAFCDSSDDWAKRELLRELIGSLEVKNAIIFCNRKRDVAILHKSLEKHGFNAGALHGDMDQSSRTATLDKFRAGEIKLLAASDVAARGLDIPDVSHIFNFDVPWQPDDYVHRIGRTGRAGKEGFSATIVTPEDVKAVESIGKLIGETPQWLGEAPDEATLAEGRSRKRGRGRPVARRGAESRSAGRPEGRSEGRGEGRAESRGRPERRTRRRDGDAGGEGNASGGERHGAQDAPRTHHTDVAHAEPTQAIPVSAEAVNQHPERERERPRRRHENAPMRRQAPITPSEQPDIQAEVGHDGQHERRPLPQRRERGEGRGDEPRRERLQQARDGSRDRPSPDRASHDRPSRDHPSHDRASHDRGERRNDAPRQASAQRDDRGPREPRRDHQNDQPRRHPRRDRDQGGPTPVGLGDHVPAFLRRPVRISAD